MSNTSGLPSATTQQLLAALTALQISNIASNEALKLERRPATAAKHVANARKAAKNAKLSTKSQTPTSVKGIQRPAGPELDQRPLQNLPTSRTAKSLWDAGVDLPIASGAEIQGRWKTNLLSGGTHGSVSLGEKEQKADNAAANCAQGFQVVHPQGQWHLPPYTRSTPAPRCSGYGKRAE